MSVVDTYHEFMRKAAIYYWQQTLFETHFNMTQAAAKAQVQRTHLYQLLNRLGMKNYRRQHLGCWQDLGL